MRRVVIFHRSFQVGVNYHCEASKVEGLLPYGPWHLRYRVTQVEHFVRGELPRRRAKVVTIPTCRLANVPVCRLYRLQVFVPVLPSQDDRGGGRPRFITDVRRYQVLQVVDCASGNASYVARTFNVPPLLTIKRHVARMYGVLVAIHTSRLAGELTVRPGTVLAFGFHFTSPRAYRSPVRRFVSNFSAELCPVRVEQIEEPWLEVTGYGLLPRHLQFPYLRFRLLQGPFCKGVTNVRRGHLRNCNAHPLSAIVRFHVRVRFHFFPTCVIGVRGGSTSNRLVNLRNVYGDCA